MSDTTEPITWSNETRRLGDLIPWEINPRTISEKEAARLNESLDEFAQIETIAVGPNNEVYNGHQRLKVWQAEHGADYEVDVRVSSRELSEDERKKLTVYLHKGATGEFDFDLLANNFEIDDLLDWGFETSELMLGNIEYIPFESEGDGGGSQMANGTKIRIVIGPHMFDIDDRDHIMHKMLIDKSVETVRGAVLEMIEKL